jgi:coatomer subunit beta'
MSEFSSSTESPSDIQFKWKQLGDLALMCGEMELSKNCAENAGDLSGLLLMHSAYGDRDAMAGLATTARKAGKFNVAFAASYILGDVHQCVDMLLHIGRVPEAALFARTYVPSRIGEVVRIWKKELSNISDVLSQALADPTEHPEGFPNLDIAMNAEQIYQQAFEQSKRCASASNYPAFVENRNSLMNENGEIDVLALLQKGNSLVSGPGFAGGSVGSSSGGAVFVKEDVKGEVKEDEVKEEEVKEEEVKLEDEDEVSEKDDDLLLDDEEEENEVQQKAPPAPAVEQKAPPAQEEAPPQEENDDDDLDDLLGDSNDDGLNGSGEDDDIDLDDLGLDDDDEWS